MYCLLAFFALAVCSVFAQDISSDSDFVTSNTLPDSRIHFKTVTPQGHKNGMAFSRFGVPPSVDSLASFNGRGSVVNFTDWPFSSAVLAARSVVRNPM